MFDESIINNLNLTKEGYIISSGIVLQSKIKVDILPKDNMLKLCYYDSMKIYNVIKQTLNKFSFIRSFGSNDIIGILPLEGDWYLCWMPTKK